MSQRGAALVEFTIVVPLLLMFFFGIIEFGLIMYNKHVMTNASREGARYGIVVTEGDRHSQADIRTEVKDWAQQRLVTFSSNTLEDSDIIVASCEDGNDCTDLASWTTPNDTSSNFGDKIKVYIQYKYDFLLLPNIPILGTQNDLPGDLTLDAETVMNYE